MKTPTLGECSTPNGIKGTYTIDLVAELVGFAGCSTPNGIKGTYTAANAVAKLGFDVLNA